MTSSTLQDDEVLFRYTSGRWLWDEQTQLDQRYRKFDILAIQEIAASSVGASACVSMKKLAEGGSNKIFRLVMDNDQSVIARIPHRTAASSSMNVASEVATMDFASTVLGIPVPKVLAWDANADNPVQAEYIIMEEASGVQLGKLWDSLKISDKGEIVKQLALMSDKFQSVSFSCYGSLYFAADHIAGCEPAIVDGSLSPDLKANIMERYAIGPVVEESYWDGDRAKISAVHGPWHEPKEWLKAIATRELTWLNKYATPRTPGPFQPSTQGSPHEHISLYKKFIATADCLLPNDPTLVRSTLWHWDLHTPNIFVTGNQITGIIDWQDCWAGPLMLQARRPKLANFHGDLMLYLPDNYKSLEEGPEKVRILNTVEQSIMRFSYESALKKMSPVFGRLTHIPQLSTIKELVLFAGNTWDAGIIPFRECLIKTLRHWSEICPDKPCPFTFTQEELNQHATESEGYNENADFWSSISGLVARDGFVLKEDYEEALGMFASLREEGLRMFEGEERDNFEKATSWAVRK